MKSILYQYIHCPYCVRVRMAANYLGTSYEIRTLRYDDEETPVKLGGRKMLPIWINENGNAINESLDIIALIDENRKLKTKETLASPEWKTLEDQIKTISNAIHSMAIPYFAYAKEFDDKSRAYFQKKKEQKRGPFELLVKNRALFEKELNAGLKDIENDIGEFYRSNAFGLNDIVLASQVWGLYLVPEFQFSPKMHAYLQNIKKICRFDYQADFWNPNS